MMEAGMEVLIWFDHAVNPRRLIIAVLVAMGAARDHQGPSPKNIRQDACRCETSGSFALVFCPRSFENFAARLDSS